LSWKADSISVADIKVVQEDQLSTSVSIKVAQSCSKHVKLLTSKLSTSVQHQASAFQAPSLLSKPRVRHPTKLSIAMAPKKMIEKKAAEKTAAEKTAAEKTAAEKTAAEKTAAPAPAKATGCLGKTAAPAEKTAAEKTAAPAPAKAAGPPLQSRMVAVKAGQGQAAAVGSRPGLRPSTPDESHDEAICRKAAVAISRFTKFVKTEHCSAKGVDKSNRDGVGKLNISDVQNLALFMHRVGYDPKEMQRCVTIWLGDGPLVRSPTGKDLHEQILHNMDMCSQSDYWPVLDEEAAQSMTQTTVRGSHANFVNRCWWFGCRTDNPVFADSRGRMSMQQLRVLDPVWADDIERGSETTVLLPEIRQYPDDLKAIIISDNIKNGGNLIEHTLQKLKRIYDYMSLEGELVSDSVRESVLRKYMATLGRQATDKDLEEAVSFFNCASRLGSGPLMNMLTEFRSSYLVGAGKRDASPDWYNHIATLPMHLRRVMVAFIQTHLACADEFVVGGLCMLIKKADIDSVKEGRSLADEAKRAETFLRKFSQTVEELTMISSAARFKAQVLANIFTVKALCKKNPKYLTYDAIAQAAWPAGVPHACPWSSTTVPDSQSTQDSQSSQDQDSGTATRALLLPTGPDGDIRGDALCRDKGFHEKMFCREIARNKDLPEDVWMLSEYIIREQEVWVLLTAQTPGIFDMSVRADRFMSNFEITKEPKKVKYLLSEPFMPMYNPIGCQMKALYVLAMHKAFHIAKDDWKVVDIMTSPRAAVLAHENLKQGRQFLVVSANILLNQDPAKLSSPAFCVDDALGATTLGTYVVPSSVIHREKVQKVALTSTTSTLPKQWDHFLNVASMIKVMTQEQAEKVKATLNCKMGVYRFPVVLSGFGQAQDLSAGIPYIELIADVPAGQELLSEPTPGIYHVPRAKPAGPKQQANAGLMKMKQSGAGQVKEPAKKKQKLDE
jgi:hypothetical protein